jgi:hypothetical protein
MEIPAAYRAFRVVKNQSDPVADYSKMPADLAEATLLFYRTGQFPCAEKCRVSIDRYYYYFDIGLNSCCNDYVDRVLEILRDGPTANRKIDLGTACVCWRCGFVGIPKNRDEIGTQTEELSSTNTLATCRECGELEDTNLVICKQPDGTIIPWMETDNMGP